jgi:chromosome segregation ATPase
MWLWWIISLMILIACIIFAYRMIVSSYEFLPADKRYLFKFNKDLNTPTSEITPVSRDTLKVLKNKVQSVEDNTTFYQIQFSKFQQRLIALEELNTIKKIVPEKVAAYEDEEDWKELYYEENAAKEQLENDLDATRQVLEETESQLNSLSEHSNRFTELHIDYETRGNEIISLEEKAKLLQKQLEASAEREKELEQLLISEISIREKYYMLQREHTELQSEADHLRKRIVELNKNEVAVEMRLERLNELESKLALFEDENAKQILKLKGQN